MNTIIFHRPRIRTWMVNLVGQALFSSGAVIVIAGPVRAPKEVGLTFQLQTTSSQPHLDQHQEDLDQRIRLDRHLGLELNLFDRPSRGNHNLEPHVGVNEIKGRQAASLQAGA
ncbi:hypothetical protein EJ110_NYTH10018 [Nymphaea thermarum]|nr:hypothetical protein EJ110_NYTH10018 [Nymphaea thermarum]